MSRPAAGEKAAENVRAQSASPSCKNERSNRPFRSPLLTDGGQILMAGANFQARVPDAAQETLQQNTIRQHVRIVCRSFPSDRGISSMCVCLLRQHWQEGAVNGML